MGNSQDKKQSKDQMAYYGQNDYRYDDNAIKEMIQRYTKSGYTEEQILSAWNRSNHNPEQMAFHLVKNQQIFNNINEDNLLLSIDKDKQKEEERMIQQAIELSIKNQNEVYIQDAENYLRTEDPIGLQNLGRTCYFNSFLQTLYHIRELRDPILKLELPENEQNVPGQRTKLNEMLKQFQLTFAAMLKSQKNFTDPTDLFEVLKGLSGQIYKQGEENDFWEFQNSTLEFLEQAFMKDSEIDTADLFKSYLRLQSRNNSYFNQNLKLQSNNIVSPQIQKIESNMEEDFIIYDPQRTLSNFIDTKGLAASTNAVQSEGNTKIQPNHQQSVEESDKLNQPEQQGQDRPLQLQKQESNKKKPKKVKNPITELFFGVGEEKVTIYSQENNSIEVKVHDIPIGIFNLDAKMGDLYSALNSYFKYQVADYQPDPIDNLTQSVIVKKQKKVDITLSIKTAPKILNFYINRIFYNKELNSAEKLNKKFTFDKEIYIDNYIQGKDKDFEEQRKQIERIDSELAQLENKLSNFDNYIKLEGSNNTLPILSAIDLIKSYLQTQIHKQDNFIDIEEIISDIKNESDEVDVGVLGQKQQIIQMVSNLEQYYQKIKQNKDFLEKKIKELRDQKQFWQNQNKTIKYELFSILIHQGYAINHNFMFQDTGHYYCYIYDDKKQFWYKFNDSIVTKVTEEEVFKQSYGDQDNNCNACCLFYKNSQTKVNPNKPVEISARLKGEVQKKDQDFLEKIDEIKIRRKFQEIKKEFLDYIKEIKDAQYQIQLSKNVNNVFTKFYNCTNFKFYLLNSNDIQNQGFGKRILLMEVMDKQDFTQLESSLAKKENLYQGITLFYEHMQSDQAICGQMLSDQEKRDLSQQEQIYQHLLKFLFKLSNILNDNRSMRKMLSSQVFQIYSQSFYFSLLKLSLKYIHEVFILKSCFMIDKYFHQGQFPNAFSLLNLQVLTFLQFYYVDKIDIEKQKKESQNDKNMIKSNFESQDFSQNIGTQLFNNLKETKLNFGNALDQDQKSKFDGQINLLQQPEKFPQSKQRSHKFINFNQNTIFEEVVLEKEININDSPTIFKIYDQYEIFLKRSDVWIQQLKKLQQQKTLIPQEERLSQEEILYFD